MPAIARRTPGADRTAAFAGISPMNPTIPAAPPAASPGERRLATGPPGCRVTG
jgi:hypothetical protein